MQHGGPEQGVEIRDVFANEVVLLDLGVVDVGVVVHTNFAQIVFERSQIANGCIEPHVKIFAGCVRNFNAEVRRVAADVPIAQAALTLFVFGEPLFDFVQHFGLQAPCVVRPFF